MSDLAQRRGVLQAFSRAVSREVSTLSQRPDLLWQQLYNRLQWEETPVPAVLEGELERRSRPDTAPWLRTKWAPRDSDALIRTLPGCACCAFSPDGTFVVSGGDDDTLKIWNARTGKEHLTISRKEAVTACDIRPDGRDIAVGSFDGTIAILEARTGQERAVWLGHDKAVQACSYSQDGSLIASFSKAYKRSEANAPQVASLRVWEADTGHERLSLKEESTSSYLGVYALSRDARVVVWVSVSDRTMVEVWDVPDRSNGRGHEPRRRTIRNAHARAVTDCAFSPDGSFFVTTGADSCLKVWDVHTLSERIILSPAPSA